MVPGNRKKASGNSVWYAVAAARVLLGFVFLWAFFDKLYGLNHATPKGLAWVNGGSPTTRYLANVHGPFAGFFHAMAGHSWVNWLCMIGLVGIGLGLILGIAVRISVVTGTILLVLMWAASLPLSQNPVVDEHVLYIALLWIVFFGYPNQVFSLGAWWRASPARWRWLW